MNPKHIFYRILPLIMIFSCLGVKAGNPKREFRGAWLQTVWQESYRQRTTSQNKAFLRDQLDKLKGAGINAVLFQVRPQADAFYKSDLEPWSRFLTDNGKAPSPAWDPLEFLIAEAHERGMELHAWLNPYRVTTTAKQTLPPGHVYHKHPEWFVRFNGNLYFDPGLPESRDFITKVVHDIVSRYDVDGIHFDDYFYPYPVKGKVFPDSKSFARYGKGMSLSDWRRHNVDLLIEKVHNDIESTKPWVAFGISPFGIWRNATSDSRGSATKGLQNYDDLYADVLLWAEKGWIDYLLPQLYWDLEHASASYLTLVEWWNDNSCGRHVFVGQDVERTMKFPDIQGKPDASQLRHKIELSRKAPNITGNCWWPGYLVADNHSGVADSLAIDFQATVALMPEYPWISSAKPAVVKDFKRVGDTITWKPSATKGTADDVVKYAVYRFEPGDPIDLCNIEALEDIVWGKSFAPKDPGVYVVTALSRVNCESDASRPIFFEPEDNFAD